jgi:SAM-dependent methyltransferase
MARKRSLAARNRAVQCEEGCGCELTPRREFLAVINGVVHHFCCVDCSHSYQKHLQTGIAKVVQERVGPGMRVADIGCGSGFYTALLMERVGSNGRVYAFDADTANVHRTEEYLASRGFPDSVTLGVAAGDHLALLPDGTLDFLLSNNVLCCTNHRAGVRREIVRVLRAGGTAYVRVSDASPRGVRPLSPEEWGRWIAPFRRLSAGTEAGSRWALLLKTPLTGPGRKFGRARPVP